MEISRTAARIRRIVKEARSASEAHSELMREYRITGPAQRMELYGVIAAELIAYMRIGEEMRKNVDGGVRPADPRRTSRDA